MKTEMKTITPELAAEMLKKNEGNRPLSSSVVRKYVDAMTRGDWQETHQGIAFGENGRLLDGQHRLAAITQSGIAQRMLVSTGIPDRSFMIFDAGSRRTDAQNMRMDKRVVEDAKLLLDAGGTPRYGRTFAPSVLENAVSKISSAHEFLFGESKTSIRFFSSSPVRCAAVCAVIFSDADPLIVKKRYYDMLSYNTSEFSVTMESLARQVANGSIKYSNSDKSRLDILGRMYSVFSCEDERKIIKQQKIVQQFLRDSISALFSESNR